MKPMSTGIVGAALLAMTAVAAQADCAAELARLTEGGAATEGISKDGSLAPLEGASDAAAGTDAAATEAADTAEAAGMNSAAPTDGTASDTAAGSASTDTAATGAASTDTASAEGEGIAKDGSHMPLEDASGQQQAGVAMSGADVQAQQEGQPTAAEQAAGASGGSATGGDQSTREAHIQAARDALAAGDEEACMMAVEAAQSS